MFGFMILNQEVVIPRIGSQLLSNRDDPRGDKDIEAHGAFEPNGIHIAGERASRHEAVVKKFCCLIPASWREARSPAIWMRSEEHTSELQSPMYLVCRLLLEKKNR